MKNPLAIWTLQTYGSAKKLGFAPNLWHFYAILRGKVLIKQWWNK